MGVFSVFDTRREAKGTRGDAEGVRGAAQVLNTKNAPHWALFRFQQVGTSRAVPNTKNTLHGPIFCVWQVEEAQEGRGGEGKGDTWACLASPVDGGGWREGHASHRTQKTRTWSMPNTRNTPHVVCFSCLAGGRGKGR